MVPDPLFRRGFLHARCRAGRAVFTGGRFATRPRFSPSVPARTGNQTGNQTATTPRRFTPPVGVRGHRVGVVRAGRTVPTGGGIGQDGEFAHGRVGVPQPDVRVPVQRQRDGGVPGQFLRVLRVDAGPGQRGDELVAQRVEVEPPPAVVQVGHAGGVQVAPQHLRRPLAARPLPGPQRHRGGVRIGDVGGRVDPQRHRRVGRSPLPGLPVPLRPVRRVEPRRKPHGEVRVDRQHVPPAAFGVGGLHRHRGRVGGEVERTPGEARQFGRPQPGEGGRAVQDRPFGSRQPAPLRPRRRGVQHSGEVRRLQSPAFPPHVPGCVHPRQVGEGVIPGPAVLHQPAGEPLARGEVVIRRGGTHAAGPPVGEEPGHPRRGQVARQPEPASVQHRRHPGGLRADVPRGRALVGEVARPRGEVVGQRGAGVVGERVGQPGPAALGPHLQLPQHHPGGGLVPGEGFAPQHAVGVAVLAPPGAGAFRLADRPGGVLPAAFAGGGIEVAGHGRPVETGHEVLLLSYTPSRGSGSPGV